jgi:hypothetical protein
MHVSYLSDALDDMAEAALCLLRGGREASFGFEDEPGEHRWIVPLHDGGQAGRYEVTLPRVKVLRRPDSNLIAAVSGGEAA